MFKDSATLAERAHIAAIILGGIVARTTTDSKEIRVTLALEYADMLLKRVYGSK